MFKRILIPLDGSEQAEKALPYGEDIAGRIGSEIILLHVCGQGQEQYKHMYKLYLEGVAQNMRQNMPDSTGVKILTEVEAGESRETVCNLVNKREVDLIIMTSVSADGIKISKMIGSVADHVCRTMPIPVMLIKPKNGQQIKSRKNLFSRIFVPLDGSELSKLALPVTEELAAKLDVPVTLFQMALMTQPTGYVTQDASYIDYALLNEDIKKRDLNEIVAIEQKFKEKGLKVDHIVTSGTNAASEIIQTSKKVNADLMVMSTHGRTGIRNWAFGSVAEKVLRYSEIPMILVNARTD